MVEKVTCQCDFSVISNKLIRLLRLGFNIVLSFKLGVSTTINFMIS